VHNDECIFHCICCSEWIIARVLHSFKALHNKLKIYNWSLNFLLNQVPPHSQLQTWLWVDTWLSKIVVWICLSTLHWCSKTNTECFFFVLIFVVRMCPSDDSNLTFSHQLLCLFSLCICNVIFEVVFLRPLLYRCSHLMTANFEMCPSWNVVINFYAFFHCAFVMLCFKQCCFMTFAVQMLPSDDSKFLRCAYLEMWSPTSMFFSLCVFIVIFQVVLFLWPLLYGCSHLMTANFWDAPILKCGHQLLCFFTVRM